MKTQEEYIAKTLVGSVSTLAQFKALLEILEEKGILNKQDIKERAQKMIRENREELVSEFLDLTEEEYNQINQMAEENSEE
ncbi:hypothetical protein [Bacillus halotolerans]|uniref:hypothetical protein n=1 Tax=Bacillus halotolerans TaxID=260554 RepID=UPI004049AF8E